MSCNIALEVLNLAGNIIDDQGLEQLSQSLVVNGCLHTINLAFNKYQLKGLEEFFKVFN